MSEVKLDVSDDGGQTWHAFDYKDYCNTGPHRPDGMRYEGPVEVRFEDGSVKVAHVYTRLIGGFDRDVGHVTHWRWPNS